MLEARESGERVAQNVVGWIAGKLRDEANTAGIDVESRIEE
jgi:hypothetical protein